VIYLRKYKAAYKDRVIARDRFVQEFH
jgi:hypothetical protein